jgi:4-methyl-5(b-hydroxyethyl)-thiazole monophosphate biosynthesis
MKKAIIILADGFEEAEAVVTIDIMRRAHINVTLAGLDSLDVRSARDIHIAAEVLLADVPHDYDALVLPGGQPGTANLGKSSMVLDMIRETANAGKLVAAICAAPSVLGKAGVLAGRRATCFPGVEKELTGAIFEPGAVVIDKNIITSRGMGTAIPFGLGIVTYLAGSPAADAISKAVVYS